MTYVPAPAVTAAPRVHFIDWLRVGAIAGVFVFHSLRAFNTEDWHVKNAETSELLTLVTVFFWLFGLAVLFLLAGAGVRFALRKRTWTQLVRERMARLLVPFVVGTLILSPVQGFIEATHKDWFGGGFIDYLGVWASGVPGQVLKLSPTVFGVGYHLWFLGFLFAISLLALPLCAALGSSRGQAAVEAVARRATWPGASLAFAVPIAIVYMVFYTLGAEEHDWAEFGWYFGYFMAGYMLFSDERFLAAVRRDLRIALVVGLATFPALVALIPGWVSSLPDRGFDWTYPAMAGMFVIEGWAWTIVVLNIGLRWNRLDQPVPTRLGEAVLPVYVLHQPVILAVAFFVVQWPLGILPKAIVVFGLSLAVTLALVDLVLRSPVTRFLLGARIRPSIPGRPIAAPPAVAGPAPARTHHARPR